MSELLHEIDFTQLKIENQLYMERIAERNKDLLRLKVMAGNTMSVLNDNKRLLQTLLQDTERVKTDTISRKDLLGRIDVETKQVERVS